MNYYLRRFGDPDWVEPFSIPVRVHEHRVQGGAAGLNAVDPPPVLLLSGVVIQLRHQLVETPILGMGSPPRVGRPPIGNCSVYAKAEGLPATPFIGTIST